MNPDTTPTPRTDAAEKYSFSRESLDVDEDGSLIASDFARKLERELTDKTNEVARLRESLDRYEDIINKQDDELIRLREENAELKKGKVFVDPMWIYYLETKLAKAHEELRQAGLREYGI